MRKGDAICPECGAGFRRMELTSIKGQAGEFRCPLCGTLIEAWDGETQVAYRLTIQPSLKSLHER
jgi:predicted Zn finger-like uncharacterized protein